MVALIRFFTGFVCFCISGSRPGTFVNELVRSGVNVWGIRSKGGCIYCCVRCSDYPLVQQLSRRRSQRVHITSKKGVPFLLAQNKRRKGLAVGVVLFFVIFHALSMFIWTVEICDFDTISQTAARGILKRVGVSEGVYADFDSLKRMQTTAMLEFGNLSWITINADGSRAEINATEKFAPETNDTAPRNMVASCDGQVIRADAYSGTAAVSAGDGVTSGQLLISGVVETELGGTHLTRADGIVLAKTRYHEQIVIPHQLDVVISEDESCRRSACRLFGAVIPLSAAPAEYPHISFISEDQAEFRGERASASLITEKIYPYNIESRTLSDQDAEKLFQNEMLLRELFRYDEKSVTERRIECTDANDGYHYDVYYTCEENIASAKPLLIAEEQPSFEYD